MHLTNGYLGLTSACLPKGCIIDSIVKGLLHFVPTLYSGPKMFVDVIRAGDPGDEFSVCHYSDEHLLCNRLFFLSIDLKGQSTSKSSTRARR